MIIIIIFMNAAIMMFWLLFMIDIMHYSYFSYLASYIARGYDVMLT